MLFVFVENFFLILPQSTKIFGRAVITFHRKAEPHGAAAGEENELA